MRARTYCKREARKVAARREDTKYELEAHCARHTVMADIGMAYIVMAYIVMARIVLAYIVMAYMVIDATTSSRHTVRGI